MAKTEQLAAFNVAVDSVVKISFGFKLTNVFESPASLLSSNGVELREPNRELENLNCASFSSELYFVVIENDLSVSTEKVIESVHSDIFKVLQPLLSAHVVLDSIQLQNFWPSKALNSFDQKNFHDQGSRPESEPVSTKPFCLIFTSSFVKSSKNAYKFSLSGVSTVFKNLGALEAKAKTALDQLAVKLAGEFVIGENKNLSLMVVAPTGKANSPLPFVPVTGCSVAGFAGNYRKSVKFSSPKKS